MQNRDENKTCHGFSYYIIKTKYQYLWFLIITDFFLSLHVWDTWLANLFLLEKTFPQWGHGNSPGQWMSSMCLLRLVTIVLEQRGHTPPPTVGSSDMTNVPGTKLFNKTRIIYFHANIIIHLKVMELKSIGGIGVPLSMTCASVIPHFVHWWKYFSTFCTWCRIWNMLIFNMVG